MCLLRINLPNLCPNMNHFDAVDFSECYSEEVMFLLMLSVHLQVQYVCTCVQNFHKITQEQSRLIVQITHMYSMYNVHVGLHVQITQIYFGLLRHPVTAVQWKEKEKKVEINYLSQVFVHMCKPFIHSFIHSFIHVFFQYCTPHLLLLIQHFLCPDFFGVLQRFFGGSIVRPKILQTIQYTLNLPGARTKQ